MNNFSEQIFVVTKSRRSRALTSRRCSRCRRPIRRSSDIARGQEEGDSQRQEDRDQGLEGQDQGKEGGKAQEVSKCRILCYFMMSFVAACGY